MAEQTPMFAISGCDTGFGLMLTHRLAAAGHRVLAGCLTEAGAAKLSSVPLVNACRLDVTDAASVSSFRTQAERLGGLRGLVNNAGIIGCAPFELETEQSFRNTMEVNFFGTCNLTRALLPLLRRTNGRVVNVSSVAGLIGFPTTGSYPCSKFAIEGWTDILRREMSQFGVSVCLLEPGFFRTNITSPANLQRALEQGLDQASAEVVDAYGGKAGIQQLGQYQRRMSGQVASSRVELVIDAMEHALTASMPNDRYLCGYDARFFWKPLSLAPSWFVDMLFQLQQVFVPNPAITKDMQRSVANSAVGRKRRRLMLVWVIALAIAFCTRTRKAATIAALCASLYSSNIS